MELKYRDKSSLRLQTSVHLTFPKISNHKVCGDYLLSKAMTRKNKVIIEDDINRNATIENHFALKTLLATEQRLKDRKELAIKQREDLDEQWEDLKSKEEILREKFIFFSKFVHENIEKRERAQLKIANTRESQKKRLQQIQEISSDSQQMQEMKKRMDENIHKMKIYEDFLAEVVETFPNKFYDVVDIMRRYDALIDARIELNRKLESDMRRLERARYNFMKLVEEKNFIIMGLNNQIANLQARFENANIKSLESEQLVLQIKNNAVKQMSDIDQVKASIWNVYTHMAHSKRHPIKIKKENVEEQMMYIKRTLTELSKVNQIIRKRAKLSNKDSKSKNN